MFCASELAGIEPTPARSGRAGYARLNLSATGSTLHTLRFGVHLHACMCICTRARAHLRGCCDSRVTAGPQIAIVWAEALRCATAGTRVQLGSLKVDLSELIPKLRLKRSRLLRRYSGIFIILFGKRGLVGGY